MNVRKKNERFVWFYWFECIETQLGRVDIVCNSKKDEFLDDDGDDDEEEDDEDEDARVIRVQSKKKHKKEKENKHF